MEYKSPRRYLPLHDEENVDEHNEFQAFTNYDRIERLDRSSVLLVRPGDGLTTTVRHLHMVWRRKSASLSERGFENTLVVWYAFNARELLSMDVNQIRFEAHKKPLLKAIIRALLECIEDNPEWNNPEWLSRDQTNWGWWIKFCRECMEMEIPRFDPAVEAWVGQSPLTPPTDPINPRTGDLEMLIRHEILPNLAKLGVRQVVFLIEGSDEYITNDRILRRLMENFLGRASLFNMNRDVHVVWKWLLPKRFEPEVVAWHERNGAEFDIWHLDWSTENLLNLIQSKPNFLRDKDVDQNLANIWYKEEENSDPIPGFALPVQALHDRLLLMTILQEKHGRLRALSLMTKRLNDLIEKQIEERQTDGKINQEIWEKFVNHELPILFPGILSYKNPFKNSQVLAVGVKTYSYMGRLPHAEQDAEKLTNLLKKHGYNENNVTCLLSEEATKTQIRDKLNFIAEKIGANDTVIFMFGGHGIYKEGSRLCLSNFKPDDLSGESIDARELKEMLTPIAKRTPNVIVILDCCYAGNFAFGDDDKNGAGLPREAFSLTEKNIREFESEGWNLLAACAPHALSYEPLGITSETNSFFTKALLSGINRSETVDPDTKCITLFLLSHYIEKAMRDDKRQEPTTKIHKNSLFALGRQYPVRD